MDSVFLTGKLAVLRTALRLTSEQFAQCLNISAARFREFEAGCAKLGPKRSASFIGRINRVFGIPARFFKPTKAHYVRCPRCGDSFNNRESYGARRYCSQSCRSALKDRGRSLRSWLRDGQCVPCRYCSRLFRRSRGEKAKFCCASHREIFQKQRAAEYARALYKHECRNKWDSFFVELARTIGEKNNE